MVIRCPLILVVSVPPSPPASLTSEEPIDVKSKPMGNIISISPFAGMAFSVVKVSVKLLLTLNVGMDRNGCELMVRVPMLLPLGLSKFNI
ncbi:hypothetical protein BVY03_01330 [bacterium K02(2017)]|nr:hypothetical protein BVY03_01330 [bacterium K02(2017)]